MTPLPISCILEERDQELQHMAIQLTPEQEMRIQAVVKTGAYPSAQDALDAAVTAVEIAAAPGFEGLQEELEGLLMQGITSRELSEEEFWNSIDKESGEMLASHSPIPRT
jgi:Arc/MetJ-type ribon-helix-helix transcriptional regulator